MLKDCLLLYTSVLLHRCTFLWETKETGNGADPNLTFIKLIPLYYTALVEMGVNARYW